jgi:GNAT superfamily N-acetyltransferase
VSGNLRFATPADAAAITGLVNLAYRVEDFFKIGDRTDPEEVSQLLGRDAFIVAVGDGGELAGAVYVRATPPRGYFGMLSVQPALQGTGLGRTLIEAAERYCIERGCTEIDLTVVNLRTELPAFYERFGYQQSGTEPWPEAELHRISRPAHFITMTRRIEADAPAGR